MIVRVVTPPDSVVALADAKRHLRVEHDEDDFYIGDLIAVATSWLDGPDGWLGRALGEQVLEASYPLTCPASERRYPFPPFVGLVSDTPQPDGRTTLVRWKAGYVPDRLAPPIRHAILLMVGHLYAHRDAVTATTAKPEQLPLGVEALLGPYRVWGI